MYVHYIHNQTTGNKMDIQEVLKIKVGSFIMNTLTGKVEKVVFIGNETMKVNNKEYVWLFTDGEHNAVSSACALREINLDNELEKAKVLIRQKYFGDKYDCLCSALVMQLECQISIEESIEVIRKYLKGLELTNYYGY